MNTGIYFVFSGLVAIAISVYLARTTGLSAVQYSTGLAGLAVCCFGFAKYFFNVILQKRIRIARQILVIALLIGLASFISSSFYPDLSYFLILIGSFTMAFTYIPLLCRNRIEKWKQFTRKSWHTYMLAYSDLLSFTSVIVGILFKILNWPGANLLLLCGFSVLILTMIGWNRLFSTEVILRKKAEDKISDAYHHLNIQADKIKEKNHEILESISYANRIQEALLTKESVFAKHLDEYFIYYKPKDIVAGDFYWAAPSENGFLYITADCTGHGVPGAFMSLLNISKLNEHVLARRLTQPDIVLNQIREDIIRVLNPAESNNESKDGMDCVLIHLDLKNKKLSYAAANNSFYIVRDGALITCTADKMPVGKFENEASFTYREMALQSSDMIYTFTDGFADQFGGPKGKKFKYKQFESLLISVAKMPVEFQRQRIGEALNNWKGELEQVDDICVIGVRIK